MAMSVNTTQRISTMLVTEFLEVVVANSNVQNREIDRLKKKTTTNKAGKTWHNLEVQLRAEF